MYSIPVINIIITHGYIVFLLECNNELDKMTCSASSKFDDRFACEKVIDGNSGTSWATRNEGIGAWIQLDFGSLYQVVYIRIKHRTNNLQKEMFKNITLEFSDGTKVDYTLNDQHKYWNVVDLADNAPVSDFVKITATSVYGAVNNGFSDVRVFGCLTGSTNNFIVVLTKP